MNPAIRSVLIAIICGMMAAAFLHDRGTVDLSFGFQPGGFLEGALTALIGGAGGFAVLQVFRLLRRRGGGAENQ
jgi:hypothetical protein